jgi:hypothetical protein
MRARTRGVLMVMAIGDAFHCSSLLLNDPLPDRALPRVYLSTKSEGRDLALRQRVVDSAQVRFP